MKFHFAGRYNGDESSLPQREHPENYVPFKEPDEKHMALIANAGAIVLLIILAVPLVILSRPYREAMIANGADPISIGFLAALLTLVPHEFLHALCFRGDVYMYTNLRKGMLFVTGTEDMSKTRFILMSLCPNIVFGFIPFIVFLIFPQCVLPGAMGVICMTMGFGDYINVFNAAVQIPKGARTYFSGMHSYWYMPENN